MVNRIDSVWDMHKSPYNLYALLLLFLPVIYYVWVDMAPPSRGLANIWLLYFALFLSGPLLLLYAFVMRFLAEEKVLSMLAFILGGAWIVIELSTVAYSFRNDW
jgi:hypothetical protein